MQSLQEITAQPFDFIHQDEHFKIAIIVSRFNQEITEALLDCALDRLHALNFPKQNITVVRVPGAVELSIAAQHCVLSEQDYLAVICLGAVIRGETDHYDYVCQQVSYGCQKLALEESIPVIFGVLTTENKAQALKRINKGADAVNTALEMISLLNQIV